MKGHPMTTADMAGAVDVYQHHGIKTAVAWADTTSGPIYLAARARGIDVIPDKTGTKHRAHDPARQLPRSDCPCPMCRDADHSPEATEQRLRALISMTSETNIEQTRKTPRRMIEVRPETWRLFAACRDLPESAELFFSAHPADAFIAHEICRSCPARRACLDYALANKIPHGIWGGVSERGRNRILRKLRGAA